jgi:type II secretory pathway component PulC
MDDKKMTSEEKLLKLIRKKDRADDSRSKTKGLTDKMMKSKGIKTESKPDGLILFNKFLIILSIISLGYIIIVGFIVKQRSADEFVASIQHQKNGSSLENPIQGGKQKPLSFYVQKFENKDLFNTSLYQTNPTSAAVVNSAEQNPTQSLKLVGIVLDDKPQAIIEDLNSQQTLFLHVGDSIQDAKVKQILEGKVIFQFKEEMIELVQ